MGREEIQFSHMGSEKNSIFSYGVGKKLNFLNWGRAKIEFFFLMGS